MNSLIAFLGLAGTLIGVWLSYWTYLNGKRLEIFQIYVQKFNAIITPDDLHWWSKAMNNEALPAENMATYEVKMLCYLNLMWEEFFLYREGMISKRLWKLWQPNICFALKTDLCRQVFDQYEHSFGPNFRQWVKENRD